MAAKINLMFVFIKKFLKELRKSIADHKHHKQFFMLKNAMNNAQIRNKRRVDF